MYNLQELNAATPEQLQEIAKTFDIKKADKMATQDLIFTILDEQAINRAKESASKVEAKRAKAGRRNNLPKSLLKKKNPLQRRPKRLKRSRTMP